jgi:LPS O-antigen subunit length determinant protein (WzzB/FepE family)
MIEFIKDVVRFKWLIIMLGILFFVGSVFFAFVTPDEFKAEAMLVPANDDSQSSLGLGSQLGGLASLAGISAGNSANDKVGLAKELLNDWYFVDSFIKEHNIKADILAVQGWDRATNNLIYDDDSYDSNTQSWKVDGDMSLEPTDWLAFNEFRKMVVFEPRKDSPVIMVTLKYYSPSMAATWLNLLIESINKKIQSIDIEETRLSIEYLESKIEQTELVELKDVFYELMQQQIKTLMLAEIRIEYVLKKVGPIKTPESKFKPKRTIVILLGSILGLLLALILIAIRPMLIDLRQKLRT